MFIILLDNENNISVQYISSSLEGKFNLHLKQICLVRIVVAVTAVVVLTLADGKARLVQGRVK